MKVLEGYLELDVKIVAITSLVDRRNLLMAGINDERILFFENFQIASGQIDTKYIMIAENHFDFDIEDANIVRMIREAENQSAVKSSQNFFYQYHRYYIRDKFYSIRILIQIFFRFFIIKSKNFPMIYKKIDYKKILRI